MFEQLPPPLLQVRHWYVNVIGCVPDHVPGFAVCVAPSVGEPEIVGWSTTRGLAEPWTIPVGFDAAESEPSAFVAVTRTRIRIPTSASRSRYVVPATGRPPMGAQLEPSRRPTVGRDSAASGTRTTSASEPDHVPRFAVSVRPSTASPTMPGSRRVVRWYERHRRAGARQERRCQSSRGGDRDGDTKRAVAHAVAAFSFLMRA